MSNFTIQGTNNRARKISLACILALTLSNCSSGGDSTQSVNSSAPGNGQQTAGFLDGTWDLCGSLRNTYVFSGNTWQQYLAYFDNTECAGSPLTSDGLQAADEPIATGTYELLREVTTEGGLVARELNMMTTNSDAVTRYDIVFKNTENELVFGTFAGFTEDDRPAALDFEAVYIRR